MPKRFRRFLILALVCAACAAPPSRVPPPTTAPTVGVEPERRVFVPQEPRPRAVVPEPRVTEQPAPSPTAIPAPEHAPPPFLPPGDDLLEQARLAESRGDMALTEELYRQAIDRGGPWSEEAEFRLAALLEKGGRFEEAVQTLGELRATSPVAAWRLRARSLEGMGRPGEAVWAYARAISLSDEIAAEEVRARIRYLIDDMTVESLTRLAAACPYCPEGGYARLRLARIDVAVGHLDPAEKALAELEVDFVGDLLGPIASELRQDLIARRAVQPGLYGLLLPLSGPLRLFGSRALRGALLGSGLFSELGDPDIRLAVADSQGDPEIAAQAVEGLARRGVVGIVGPLKGSAAVEAARVAGSLGIPLVALTPAPEVTKEHAFRLYLREEDEVGRLVEYAAEREQMRRFAILYPDTPLGLRYRDLFWDEVVERGGEITGVEAFSSEPGSVGEAIQRLTGVYGLTPSEIRERFLEEEGIRLRREQDLMAALGIQEDSEGDGGAEEIEIDAERLADYKPRPTVDFDGVFLPVSSLEAAQIAPQFPFRDVEGVALLGIRSWNHQALVEVGEEYVEGAIFPAEIHPEAPAARGFFAAYRGAYGEAPGVIEAYAFDAVGLLVRSSADFEDETRSTLRKRLRALWDVAGATGPLTIHPEGDIAPAPKILAVRRGRIVPAN